MERINGWCDDLKCFVACLFFEESQQPTCPQERQSRRWIQVSPNFTQSSQTCFSVVRNLIWSVCLQFMAFSSGPQFLLGGLRRRLPYFQRIAVPTSKLCPGFI